jgi:hypothetical protein
MNIQQLINNAVNVKREKKEITSWHISKIGSCMRGIYLERLGKKPDKPFDDRILRVFSVGHQMEDWLCDLIKDSPGIKKTETQLRVEDEKLGVSGYADLFIEYEDGKKRLYEIKTKHSKAFWWMDKKGEDAQLQHQYQLWMYLYLLNIEKGSIVYLSKDDLCVLEFPVFRDNEKLKKEVFEILDLLNKAWKLKDPSILPLPDKDDWRAKFCNYHKQCVKLKC